MVEGAMPADDAPRPGEEELADTVAAEEAEADAAQPAGGEPAAEEPLAEEGPVGDSEANEAANEPSEGPGERSAN